MPAISKQSKFSDKVIADKTFISTHCSKCNSVQLHDCNEVLVKSVASMFFKSCYSYTCRVCKQVKVI